MFTFPVTLAASTGIANPLAISNCVVWLRSDLGVHTTSGNVDTWANQGSLGVSGDATQGTGGLRPAYAASGGLNNRAKLTFSSSALEWAYTGIGAKTIVVVMKLTSTPGTGFTVYETYNNTPFALWSEMIVDLATYQNTSFVDDWSAGGTMFGHNDTIGTTVGHVFYHTYDGTGGQIASDYTAYLDGVSKTVNTSGAYGIADTSSRIGSRSAGTFALAADLYEIIIYNRVLSATEEAQIETYAANLYAL